MFDGPNVSIAIKSLSENMTLVPVALLSGGHVLEAMLAFSFTILVLAPPGIALLAFGGWLLSAPNDAVRWSESWVRVGTNVGIGLWLVNLLTEALALWAWFFWGKSLVPSPAIDRSLTLAILSVAAPGIVLTSIGLSIVRAMVTPNDYE